MNKPIYIKKHGIKCPYCENEIGTGANVKLDYETISLEYSKGGKPDSPSSTYQIIFCTECGKIIEIAPHRIPIFNKP